ncbi:DUF5931 domain-containing protein [Nocardia mikamii]|uniref:DUF5931 domain-containing protein n=1 Tax=Nocardia mikamii TaxID=508464 RepID=UPI0024818DB7|nr:DUF5931 domain-containing protein [Nocardia mikamii]
MPGPTAATAPLWRAAQVFRLVTMLYAVGRQFASVSSYQRQPLSWVLIGVLDLSAKQIATRLSVSHRMVENHVQATLRKLQLGNRGELTRYTIEQGLEQGPDQGLP